MTDLTPFKEGIQAAMNDIISPCLNPMGEAIKMLTDHGARIQGTLDIGQLTRVKGDRCKGADKDFWYVYNQIDDSQSSGHIIGVMNFGYWKDGTSFNWSSRSEHQMSTAERTSYHAKRESMKIEQELETKAKQSEAAKIAFEIWTQAPDAKEHKYLANKGVRTTQGLKIANDGRLIVPVAIDNEIVTLQFIDDDGEKRFLTGGKKKGGWFLIEGKTDVIYIAEGYSTARSVHEATNATVYVAFDCGNIYEVSAYVKTTHANSRIIIAGDDDAGTTINAGRTKAEQAAAGLGIEAVFPVGFVDFNDQHKEQGIGALKSILKPEILNVYRATDPNEKNVLCRPSGTLGNIFDYYNATSGNSQEGFAIQTSLAICGTVLGRRYKSIFNNWSNLFLLCVGKSATGKEHIKFITDKILDASECGHYISGDGYTSGGAVFSTLLRKPNHITVIDEFGRYLEASRADAKGNSNQREAITKLMEAIGRNNGIMKPPNYSTMTLKNKDKKELEDRVVHNPSIMLVATTTPSTLFKSLDIEAVKNGFINRFTIFISNAKRMKRMLKPDLPVPEIIINWIEEVTKRSNDAGYCESASENANPITLDFTQCALKLQGDYEQECIDKANLLETQGMAELVGRSNEMAMRMSLIHALSRNPHATVIDEVDMQWSINYVRRCQEDTIEALKLNISYSQFEADKKEILMDLRQCGDEGKTKAKMTTTPPYSKHKPRELREILESLKDAGLIDNEPYIHPKGGKPTIKWVALQEN